MWEEALALAPPWFIVLVLAASPIMELRGAIPLGIIGLGMDVREAVFLSVLGNLAILPVVIWLVPRLEAWGRRSKHVGDFVDRVQTRARRKAGRHVRVLREAALLLVVALPVPGAGAWTAAVVAHLYEMPRHHTYLMLVAGVLLSAVIVTAATVAGHGAVDVARAVFRHT